MKQAHNRAVNAEKNRRIQALHDELDVIHRQLRCFPRSPNTQDTPQAGLLYDLLTNRMSQINIELGKLEGKPL
jgi:hypothetical protein